MEDKQHDITAPFLFILPPPPLHPLHPAPSCWLILLFILLIIWLLRQLAKESDLLTSLFLHLSCTDYGRHYEYKQHTFIYRIYSLIKSLRGGSGEDGTILVNKRVGVGRYRLEFCLRRSYDFIDSIIEFIIDQHDYRYIRVI